MFFSVKDEARNLCVLVLHGQIIDIITEQDWKLPVGSSQVVMYGTKLCVRVTSYNSIN